MVLFCFVFQYLGKDVLFHSGFFLRNGALLFWGRSGATIQAPGRFFVFVLVVVFALVLGCSWGGRVWTGRPGPGRFFFDFFGPPFLRPKWPPGFCPNTQKHMVLKPFMQNGGLAEIVSCEPLCSESSCFLECFCEFWWAPFGTKWALWCEFDSFARRFQCFARTPFWSRFGLLCELQALLALWRPELVAGR